MHVLGLMLTIGAITLSHALPTPKKDHCKFPPRHEFMELMGIMKEVEFPLEHVVRYTCRPGYSRLGSSKMVCKEGSWHWISRGQCKKKSCGNPGDIDFGTFELKNGDAFVFGAIVEYSCEPGYRMITKYKTIECTATGWSRGLPHCEARLCPPVVDDSVRVFSTVFDEEYTIGRVIDLQCKNPNDKLVGPSQIYCTSNGTWNADPPTCKGPCIVQNDKMKQHNIWLKMYQKLHFAHDEVIEFECKPGYEISDPKTLTIKCNEGVVTYPTCHLKERNIRNKMCPPPPEILFGESMGEKKQLYDSGFRIHYKCLSYFKLKGKEKIKCQNGVWENPPACLEPCVLNYNYIKGKNTIANTMEKYIVHGETVKFDCLPTFKISNPKQLNVKCLKGKLKYPKCVKMVVSQRCDIDESIMQKNNISMKGVNNHHVGQRPPYKSGIKRYKENEIIEFTCLPGYEISDHERLKAKCLNGVIEYPKCLEITAEEITVPPSVQSGIY